MINTEDAFRKKNPNLYRKLPKFIFRLISVFIKEDKINREFFGFGTEGVGFAKSTLNHLNVEIFIKNIEKLDKNKQYIFVSNHPLGAIDGLVLITSLFDAGFSTKVVVNDLLNQITPLKSVTLAINLYGGINKSQLLTLNQTLKSKHHVLIFPAGQVSKIRGLKIEDVDWSSFFIKKANETKREVVPLFFEGRNSLMFYLIAYLRKLFGVKINLEMLMLPRQLFFAKGKKFNIYCGDPIPQEEFEKEKQNYERLFADNKKNKKEVANHLADWVKNKVYHLKKR